MSTRGEFRLNTRLKRLIKELGDAINGSLSESDQIARVIAKIKDEGFDIFLVLEATIGFNRQDDEGRPASPELVGLRRKASDPEFTMTAHDVRFLKSLRISVDDAA
jgi:hypothetical protein